MDSEIRLRICSRPACDARRSRSSIGSCCDEKCLESIAQVSFRQPANDRGDAAPSTPRKGIYDSLAQWKAALERAECLCSEMLKMGLPSCCATRATELFPVKEETRVSPKKCCSTTSLENAKRLVPEATTGKSRSCCSVTSSSNTCCSSPPDATKFQCNTGIVQAQTAKHSCPSEDSQPLGGHHSLTSAAIDLEKGSAVQHVVAQISGMTCTGCERKLERVLSSIAGVHDVKTSLVLGRAEFDVDAGLSINDVVLLLERQSGFKCVVRQEGHQLEVLIPEVPSTRAIRLGTAAAASEKNSVFLRGFAGPNFPSGVEDVQIFDSKGREWKSGTAINGLRQRSGFNMFSLKPHKVTARISYNPHVLGARDLLEKGFGSPLSLAPLNIDHPTATDIGNLRHTLYMTLLSALLTIPILIMAWCPLPPHKIAYGSGSLALATLVQFIIAGPFYSKALKALLFSGMIEIELLIVISTTTAYVYSVVAFVYETNGHTFSTGGFFETSTLLVTLIMFGRLASTYARRKAADSISVQALQPFTALLSENGNERLIDVREFQYGDLFKILPDSIVPTDGTIMSGETEIDESMITGEAVPVPKSPGSQILAGCINGSGAVLALLTKLPIDNTVSKIVSMVDEAKLSKPRVQETADRVASYFVPCILAITIAIFSIWIAIGISVRNSSASDAIVTAMTYALAALIASCPCAIGLAVPMVMVIAGGVGAKHGVIFKSPEAIAIARNVCHVVFDKTGTLTQGKFVVVEEIYRGESRNHAAASIAYELTSSSKHPVSQALAIHLKSHGNSPAKLAGVSSIVGRGMHATLDGQSVIGGNPLYVDVVDDLDVQRLLSQGLTVFCLRQGSALLAIYGLRDALRIDTLSVVSALQARNILVSIVSGDSIIAVDKLATELSVPLSHVKGQCTPEDKARYITSLSVAPTSSKSKTPMVTIFCGDGSNDAIALARASLGIHMAGGTDLAKSAADVVLTHKSLSGILVLLDLSRASMRRVYFNFAWSFVYNLFAILLAAGAFLTVRIPPAYAGLGELVSVLPVIAVAMQLRWMKFG